MNRRTLGRQWLRQFVGVLALALITWAFLNTPDQKGWNLALSALLALAAIGLGTWLITRNFTDSIGPQPPRFLLITTAIIAMLVVLFLLDRAEDRWIWRISTWLASAASLYGKKPLLLNLAYQWVEWAFFFVRWIVLPLLFIPLFTRAAGSRLVRPWRFVLAYLAAFLVGAVLPHYIVHWVPRLDGLWPQLFSVVVRFSVAYLILITAWVMLGRLAREEAPL